MFSITKQGHLPNAAAHTSSDSVNDTHTHAYTHTLPKPCLVLVVSEADFDVDFEVIMGNIIKWTMHKVTHFHCALCKTILQYCKYVFTLHFSFIQIICQMGFLCVAYSFISVLIQLSPKKIYLDAR